MPNIARPSEPDRRSAILLAAWFICLLAYLALIISPASAAPDYPKLTGRIVDQAGLIKPEDKTWIETELSNLENASTDQVAVVTVNSLQGYAIEDYSIGLARTWQIGQKDKDNGIILLVAPKERKVRIEVGRRLEPIMTDTMAKLIIENAILSKFRRGDFSGGIRDGVRDIKAVLLGNEEEVAQRAKQTRQPESISPALIHFLIWLAIIGFIVWQSYRQYEAQRRYEQSLSPAERRKLRKRRSRHGPFVIVPGDSGWSGGRGWSGGGGGWSGGGGSFGGGGASGSW